MRALFALFIRSVREDMRAKLPPILRTAMVVIVLLVLWSSQRSFSYRTAAGIELLMIVMFLNAGFLAVAAVSIFPSAITEEKEDETLPLLRMTNLNPLSILLGKAAPRLLGAMLLLAVQVPFTILAITLGGVTMSQVLGAYAILGATAVFLCGIALFASVYCRTALRASFLTGILGGLFYVGLPLLGIALALNRMRPWAMVGSNASEHFFIWLVESNPVFGIGMLIERSTSAVVWPVVWRNLAGGAIFAGLAWLLFDRYCAQLGEGVTTAKKGKDGRPRRRWASVPRTWRWPMIWKDFYFMVGGRTGFLLRCGLGLVVFLCAYGYTEWIDPPYQYRNSGYNSYYSYPSNSDYDHPPSFYFWEQVAAIMAVVAMMACGLELLLHTSRLFGVERSRQTLSSLVILPWNQRRIIFQKAVGCLGALLPWFLLAFAALILHWEGVIEELEHEVGRISWERDKDDLAALLYVFLQGVLLLLVIVWFSLRIRRGALPAAIAVMATWNILFGIWVDEVNHRNEVDVLFAGVFLSLPAVVFMCVAVKRRLELAGAEE
jgi:hypothetical protein